MKKISILVGIGIALGVLGAWFFIFRYYSEKEIEKTFRATYGSHSDFTTIYSVIQENQTLIAKKSDNDAAYDSLAQGYYTLGALDEARDAITQAVRINSGNDSYWSRLGQIYQRKKEYPLALAAYEKALEVNPKKKDHYQKLSWLYYFRFEGMDHAKAFSVLERALTVFPKDKDFLFDITRYHLYDNNVKEFLKYAPHYLKINPYDKAMEKDYEKMKKIMSGEKKASKK